jgi:PPK2 family polyphosphate:nucleotide phosphotransferase
MTMKISDKFRANKKQKLDADSAGVTVLGASAKGGDKSLSKSDTKALDKEATQSLTEQLALCQTMLYASQQQKVLLVLQGMDSSGKDGTISAMFNTINPMGLRAVRFKAPTDIELAHDYLWRVHQQVPVKGEIAIFNRSHYEDVVVVRVQQLIDQKECERRYAQIRDFERMLAETGTVIIKIFLHISKEEQRERLQQRLDDPHKQWKFDPNDITQRKLWDDYQQAYEQAIRETDADHAPWYVVPANSKTQRNLIVASLLLETMENLKLSFPAPDPDLTSFKVV